MLKLLQKTKNLFFKWNLHKIFGVLEKPMRTTSNLIRLSEWINKHKNIKFNDFYSPKRDNGKRVDLYNFVIQSEELQSKAITYLEFGVANGVSFKLWVNNLNQPHHQFHGFDTFTGLPEDWGHFKKGDMSAGNSLPNIENDNRHYFYQGLFQQTLPNFINENKINLEQKLIIHLDADLYSSTLYVLTSLAPFLKDGDIIFFDEFNVPNHEFLAFEEFTKSYYIEYEVIGAVNNYYQIAVKIK